MTVNRGLRRMSCERDRGMPTGRAVEGLLHWADDCHASARAWNPCERKSMEPMAALTAPHRTAAQHQSLLHFVGEGKCLERAGAGQGTRASATTTTQTHLRQCDFLNN